MSGNSIIAKIFTSFSFVVNRDAYLYTNPKIVIYRDAVFRGDTHPYK